MGFNGSVSGCSGKACGRSPSGWPPLSPVSLFGWRCWQSQSWPELSPFSGEPASPQAPATRCEFHRLLDQADAQVARWNLHRSPGETLHQFARRLQTGPDPVRPLADWYRLYATLRYRSQITAQAVTRLKTVHHELTESR
ncbi:MAG: DUF4129 domain-containing protein [Planctomycetes bacterium]|nr:DUF4129 domain-containing protein [Planctomycetota bacterium]